MAPTICGNVLKKFTRHTLFKTFLLALRTKEGKAVFGSKIVIYGIIVASITSWFNIATQTALIDNDINLALTYLGIQLLFVVGVLVMVLIVCYRIMLQVLDIS